MEVILYYNESDDRNVNKSLLQPLPIAGTLVDETSVMNPSFLVDSDEVLRRNYCYVTEFERYYWIKEVSSVRTGLWRVDMECDVLMSFRRDIFNLNAVVDKQTDGVNGDEYIDDGSLVTENSMFTRIYNFPNGFNSTGKYILITAG